MTASTAPNLGLNYGWTYGEDNWNTGMDSNLFKIDTLSFLSVKNTALATPPGSPTLGDRYIVATGGTGAWSGLDGKVVVYNGSGYTSYTPKKGWLAQDENTGTFVKYSGSVWASDPLGDRAYADSLVTGLWNDRGNYDASGNAYPSSGGSGTAGAIKKGDIWTISVAGTLPTGQAVEIGDTVRALSNTPGNTQSNWAIGQNNIGYTPENAANKDTDGTLAANSDTKYASQKATKTYVDTAIAAQKYTINTQSGSSYTLTLADCDGTGYIVLTNASAGLVVPANASVAAVVGKPVTVRYNGSGTATISAAVGVTLNGNTSFAGGNETKTLVKIDTNTWDIIGG